MPHVGPMAQDFHGAFGLGTDDKHLATVGRWHGAGRIQGLNQKLTEELEQKGTEITKLKQRLDSLEKMVRNQESGIRIHNPHMKIKSLISLGLIILHSAFCFRALAQSSSLNSFTYQGRLHDTNGPASGFYDFSFALFPASSGGSQVGTTITRGFVPVTNGLFAVPLEFPDANSFPGADRWLEIAVHPSGVGTNITLSPRQQITAAPYAIRAANLSGPLPLSQLPAGVVTNNGSGVTLAGTFTGNGAGLSNVNARTLGGLGSAGFWKTDGNEGANPTNAAFVGTLDNLPLEFRVNGQRALRLEPHLAGPNIIGGFANNEVAQGTFGAVIGGGTGNQIRSSVSTISGGNDNSISENSGDSTIGGGDDNHIFSGSRDSTIGGGQNNTVWINAPHATIAGGNLNNASGRWAAVSGGANNHAASDFATVSGGISNVVAGSWSTIAGGTENKVTGDYSTVSGGAQNVIVATADAATIGGGDGNVIQSATTWSTIAGGRLNVVRSNNFSPTIAGGEKNAISPNASFSSIGGGLLNSVASENASVGGGNQNTIQSNAINATIGGGAANTVRSNSWRGTIGGGVVNTVGAPEGTVAGGAFNSALGFSATVGGGGGNAASGAWSTIAGGRDNVLTNANYATIGGGVQNTIQTSAEYATVGGGAGNIIHSNAHFATIPGGRYNSATNYAFAAGNRAKANHPGAFVWADTADADYSSTGPNQFLIRAGGGVGINNNNPNGAALAVNGDVNVEGIISANALSAASATTPAVITPRISTAGNVPLEFFVNGQRGLRLEPTATLDTVNVIGGSALNFVGAGAVGATIGGGGSGDYIFGPRTNRVDADFGTVSGGFQNLIEFYAIASTIGGGNYNTIQSNTFNATIGGGWVNTIAAHADYSTIGGGDRNTIHAGADRATIPGGILNTIHFLADHATIGGGSINTIQGRAAMATLGGGRENTIRTNGEYATIPGGHLNSATNYAFAAGRRAKADRTGAFVWADSTDADFAATANNQFLVRAAGGVGIGTPNPQGSLHVYSDNNPTVMRIQSTGTPGFGRLEFVSNPQGDANEWRPGYIQSTDNGGFAGGLAFFVNGAGAGNKFGSNEVMRIVNGRVGIGTTIPVSALQVVGTVTATAFNPPSDRNLKENFTPVSPRDVLDKIAAMPISRWNFIGDAATPHVGPMAQDFHAAFGLGTDDKHIATVDADGVALAAIQGLNQKLTEELQRRDAENTELKQRLTALERIVHGDKRE